MGEDEILLINLWKEAALRYYNHPTIGLIVRVHDSQSAEFVRHAEIEVISNGVVSRRTMFIDDIFRSDLTWPPPRTRFYTFIEDLYGDHMRSAMYDEGQIRAVWDYLHAQARPNDPMFPPDGHFEWLLQRQARRFNYGREQGRIDQETLDRIRGEYDSDMDRRAVGRPPPIPPPIEFAVTNSMAQYAYSVSGGGGRGGASYQRDSRGDWEQEESDEGMSIPDRIKARAALRAIKDLPPIF